MLRPDSPALRYHDGTKHHFDRFARSLGYLDWASQPAPFRTFLDTTRFPLFPSPGGALPPSPFPPVTYGELREPPADAAPLSAALLGDLLRHSLGLSAWKAAGRSRWSLRVNPSSGNLHPTEAYVLCAGLPGLSPDPAVYHYASDLHALELRCSMSEAGWRSLAGDSLVLVGLTSIHWRESWKYGERAFRYCQHDLGHAIAAVAFAARLHGWEAHVVPAFPRSHLATLLGCDRDADYFEAEREEPACVLALRPAPAGTAAAASASFDLPASERLASLTAAGTWTGRASQLSVDHVDWSFIDEVAAATRDEQRAPVDRYAPPGFNPIAEDRPPADARALILQRRSAVAFDARSSMPADRFFSCLSRLLPTKSAPWQALWWPPRIHLVLFVHRVDDVAPGIYLLLRDDSSGERLRGAIKWEVQPERPHPTLPLVCLGRGDCRSIARRLSCDQDIAADGFFSLGMIADFAGSLDRYGDSFYRHLFWESGVLGQVLYLEAEAAGARGTGIGCFYDDGVHELLGLKEHGFQSLYHFAIGQPVEDRRLTVEPGYEWERARAATRE